MPVPAAPSYPPLRPATDADAERILELSLVNDIARTGEPDSTIAEIETDLANRSFRAMVLDGPDDVLAGYVWVEHPPEHSLVWGELIARPGSDPDVAQLLLDWLVPAATEFGPGLSLHLYGWTTDLDKKRLYESVGGTVIRHSYRMAIDVSDASIEAPVLGEGVAIEAVTTADLPVMHKITDTAFLDHFAHEAEPYDEWLARTAIGMFSDLSLWWIATVDGVPAAGLYGGILPSYGYIDTLGTLRAYRGQGLGRALLLTAFAEFQRRGQQRVSLGVDATNPTGAVHLYESVGMHVVREGVRYLVPMS